MKLSTATWVLCTLLSTTSYAHELAPTNGATPWTHLEFSNDPSNFQFAIVSDRTGGHRPGVFPAVLERVNLLQPELVMSVGDYIEGYTESAAVLRVQWEEIDAKIEKLDAPFFYVPGNHDHSNDVMAELWRQRFGRSHYHFVYKNVLFVVLNTEDPHPADTPEMDAAWARLGEVLRTNPAGARQFLYTTRELAPLLGQIGAAQRDETVRAIKEHADVRWTFLFMHRPIWHKMAPNSFHDIEAALEGRHYTAFAGHEHSYQFLRRHDHDYMTLGTSGGGWSAAPPARQGQFDHFTWVTMRDDGPVFAHVLASGVFGKEGLPAELPGAEFCGEAYRIECRYQKATPPEVSR